MDDIGSILIIYNNMKDNVLGDCGISFFLKY